MSEQKETLSFKTEVKQLLDLMIHSLYSNKEIFLRELISNASDAADKLRFEALSDESLFEGDSDLHVYIGVNKEARTITVRDNGIGMNRQEVVENIGTIASSGTRKFVESLSGDKAKDSNLIGQFGVGFYSSFIIADKVTITSRRAGLDASHGVRWESSGDGQFSIENLPVTQRGTEITLHLREGEDEFLEPWRLRSIVHKYAEHIPFPIRMETEEHGDDDEDDEQQPATTIETVNKASALWSRSPNEISEEEYATFYRHVSHDYQDPLGWMHKRLEGKYEYTLLLYLPKNPPFDLWSNETAHGVKLYVRRVFIMEANDELMPRYLRFVRGVIDSNDLPLNVSREILQKSPAMTAMKKGATSRVLGYLEELAKDGDKYGEFWGNFGNVLKEGAIEDHENRQKIAGLLRFASTTESDQKVSLADYIGRMKEGQSKIYYQTAESHAAAASSPHLEIFRKKGIEVLLLSDRIDEWLTSHLTEFEGKSLQAVSKGSLDLSGIEDDAERQQAEKEAEAAKPVVEKIKVALGERVKEVRATHRLTESPACLVSEEFDISKNLERILRQAGQKVPEVKPILEINPEHRLVRKIGESDEATAADLSALLFDLALIAEGGKPEEAGAFVQRVNRLVG